jgi:hypothetical protein
MSIENKIYDMATALGRIADALEKIIDVMAYPTVSAPTLAGGIKMPFEDNVPGINEPPMQEAAVVEDDGAIKTPAELRELAQKYIQKAGEKTGGFVAFIREQVCMKFNPAEPKLIKIDPKNVAEAAKMITEWAKKHKIEV